MTENANKAQRFWHWFNTAMIPSIYVSWFLLALEVGVIGVSIWRDSYGWSFWLLVALSLWTVYDLAKYYWRKKKANPDPVGPEDSPDWN